MLIQRVQVLNNRGTGIGAAHGAGVRKVTIRDSHIWNSPRSAAFPVSLGSEITVLENSEIRAERGYIYVRVELPFAPEDVLNYKVTVANNSISGTGGSPPRSCHNPDDPEGGLGLLRAVMPLGSVLIQANHFTADYKDGPLAPGSAIIELGPNPPAGPPTGKMVSNDIDIIFDPLAASGLSIFKFGNLVSSSMNTFRFLNPSEVHHQGYASFANPGLTVVEGDLNPADTLYPTDTRLLVPWSGPGGMQLPLGPDNRLWLPPRP